MKKVIHIFIFAIFLSACISVDVDEPPTPEPSNFVTATLAPTKAGYIPPTLTPTVETTIAPTLAITVPANCTTSAVLLRDVTIPDGTQMKAGETFTKTWEFLNNGTCPWVGFTIQFDSGDQMNAPLSAPIVDTLPKDKVEASVDLTAPTANGSYTGNFTLNDASGNIVFIGTEQTFWVKINVGGNTVSPTSSGSVNTPSVSTGGNCSYSQNAGYVDQIASLINQERANAGLPSLSINSTLTSAAQNHAADMACNGGTSHTGSDGSSSYTRVLAAGYAGNFREEIIYGGGGPQAAMTWWMNDQIHRDAILNPKSTEMGIGYANFSGDYIVVEFGSP